MAGPELRHVYRLLLCLHSASAPGEGLVLAESLATVEIRVDAGVQLVEHVALVRAGGVRGRTGAVAKGVVAGSALTVMVAAGAGGVVVVASADSAGVLGSSSAGAVAGVGIDAGIKLVHCAGAVGSGASGS